MWDFASFLLAVSSSMEDVVAFMHVEHAICGLFHPPCGTLQPGRGLSLGKKGNEGIVLCGSYRAFANVQSTFLSLTTRAYMDLRLNPH